MFASFEKMRGHFFVVSSNKGNQVFTKLVDLINTLKARAVKFRESW